MNQEKTQCDKCLTIFTGMGDLQCPECGGKMHTIINTSLPKEEIFRVGALHTQDISEEEPIGADCQCELGSPKHYHPDCEYLKESKEVKIGYTLEPNTPYFIKPTKESKEVCKHKWTKPFRTVWLCEKCRKMQNFDPNTASKEEIKCSICSYKFPHNLKDHFLASSPIPPTASKPSWGERFMRDFGDNLISQKGKLYTDGEYSKGIEQNYKSDKKEVEDIIDFITSIIKETEEKERQRIIKLIKEKGLHLGYKNDIINLISKDNE